MPGISLVAAFLAGFVSFFGACIIPLLPPYFSWLFSISERELGKVEFKKKMFFHSLLIVIGFSVFFVILGASASLFGSLLVKYRLPIQKIGGLLMIFFGLQFMGFLKGFRFSKKLFSKMNHKSSSFLVGLVFAFAWVACFSPILGSILVLSSFQETLSRGVILLSVYSLGLAVPFLSSSLLLGFLMERMHELTKALKYINILSGIIIIIFGLLFLTDNFSKIVSWLYLYKL